jgi:putative DNA primase/helicase
MSGRAGAADDPVAAFIEAMRAAGLEPVGAIRADGRLHRVTWHGDRKGSENGWYVLHVDGYPAGAFGCWKRGIRETWAARGEPLDEATRRRLAQQVERERKRRQKELREAQERAAKRAAAEWESARPAPSEHAYLRRKGIRPHLARVDGRGRLVLPMRDADGKLWGLQRIPAAPKARKLFSTGARVDGCFALLGELAERVVICEGFATGASVHEATGLPVLVAFAAAIRPAGAARS